MVQIRPQSFYLLWSHTDTQTDTQTNASENIFPHFSGDNNMFFFCHPVELNEWYADSDKRAWYSESAQYPVLYICYVTA